MTHKAIFTILHPPKSEFLSPITSPVSAGLYVHPWERWRLLLAPGFESSDGEEGVLFRTELYYDIPAGGWTISLNFGVDFIDRDEHLIYGVAFGRHF